MFSTGIFFHENMYKYPGNFFTIQISRSFVF
jgi:hypothetical protein